MPFSGQGIGLIASNQAGNNENVRIARQNGVFHGTHSYVKALSGEFCKRLLKLVDANQVAWQNRSHFFAISARLMRRILVDFARSRRYLKRGGGARDLSLDEALTLSTGRDAELVTLDEALNSLSLLDARKGQVVELRFFGGLSVEETAEALKISANTVRRDWKFAKLWLAREMSHVA